jgi:hypothetical protein
MWRSRGIVPLDGGGWSPSVPFLITNFACLCMYSILLKIHVLGKTFVFPGPWDAFFPEKCDLNLTCILCAEGKYYFQTYKYLYICCTSLSWGSEICFQIMRSGIIILWLLILVCNSPVFFQWFTKIKIHSSSFFLKFQTKKSQCVLWAGKYGNCPPSVEFYRVLKKCRCSGVK